MGKRDEGEGQEDEEWSSWASESAVSSLDGLWREGGEGVFSFFVQGFTVVDGSNNIIALISQLTSIMITHILFDAFPPKPPSAHT